MNRFTASQPLARPELPFVLALKRALDRALVRASAPNATDEERAAARRLETLLKARGRRQEALPQ